MQNLREKSKSISQVPYKGETLLRISFIVQIKRFR